jgi:hypothetical protein
MILGGWMDNGLMDANNKRLNIREEEGQSDSFSF